MADLSNNSDNKQTVYVPSDSMKTTEQNNFRPDNQRLPQGYPEGNVVGQQIYGAMYANQQQRQSPAPYNGQSPMPPYSGQTPPPYGGQPQGYPQQPVQNMFGGPVGYNNQAMGQMPPAGYGKKKKKGNTGVIVLVIIAILLLSAVVGMIIAIILGGNDDDDDTGSNRAHDSSSSVYKDEDEDEDEDKVSSVIREDSSDDEDKTDAPELRRYSMPNVCGINGNEAVNILEDAGFIIKIKEEYSNEPENTVIDQSVPEETVVVEGTEITLTVSLGQKPSEDAEVPDVHGKKFEEAKNQLENCELFVNTAYEESDTVASGCVIEQNVAPGTKVKKGTSILIIVSTGSSTPQYQQGRVVTEETDLNVRKGPGKEHDVVGMVARGSIVEIAEKDGDWYKIVFKNDFGYVSKDYIELIN